MTLNFLLLACFFLGGYGLSECLKMYREGEND